MMERNLRPLSGRSSDWDRHILETAGDGKRPFRVGPAAAARKLGDRAAAQRRVRYGPRRLGRTRQPAGSAPPTTRSGRSQGLLPASGPSAGAARGPNADPFAHASRTSNQVQVLSGFSPNGNVFPELARNSVSNLELDCRRMAVFGRFVCPDTVLV